MAQRPLDRPPSMPETPLFAQSFCLADLSRVRRDVEQAGRRCGLTDDLIEDWLTAVNELMINAIRHGGGRGTVSLSLGEQVICEVKDEGPGFDTSRYVPASSRPPLSGSGGMGLWLVAQLTVVTGVDSGPRGTTVRIAARSRDSAG